MTIYKTLLNQGYFPKELPPAFFTEQFAKYATTKQGRAVLQCYKPSDNRTECVAYQLALPGLERRHLRIPHPATFAILAQLTAKHFSRLLKKAGRSPFSKSRPVYGTTGHRAIQGLVRPANLARERSSSRAGASYLLKVDVSQFYPSLYTHAVGWALNPELRKKSNWNKHTLLGKKIDQALMNLQGKVSQGIPIGNDISFLLAELVLAQVDRALKPQANRSYRWFDDYEFACDTREQAEAILARIRKELHAFRLRINSRKTAIMQLPQPSQDDWQQILQQQSKVSFERTESIVQYFDTAFRLRERYPDLPVLLYALGILFKLRCPNDSVGRVAQSGITQALLCEPGAAQKGFALLTFWHLNGFALDRDLLTRTINRMILNHRAAGVSSDVSWALAFCLEQRLVLGADAGNVLSVFDDDCITLQALHANSKGLLPRGFVTSQIRRILKNVDMDGEHWLIGYEALRHGFLADSAPAVASNALFSDLLTRRVTFYRTKLPAYASIIHPGGAPEWAVRVWLEILQGRKPETPEGVRSPVVRLIEGDLPRARPAEASHAQIIADLMDLFEAEEFAALLEDEDQYAI